MFLKIAHANLAMTRQYSNSPYPILNSDRIFNKDFAYFLEIQFIHGSYNI